MHKYITYPLQILFTLLLLAGCKDSDDEVVISYIPENHTADLVDVEITGERDDVFDYCALDSLRGRFLFVNMTKQTILSLDSINGTRQNIFCASDVNSDFAGQLQFVYVLPDGNYLLYEHYDDNCDCLWKLWPDEERMEKVFTYRNKYQFLKWNWSITYDDNHNIIYLSEYGVSNDNPINPQDSRGKSRLGYKGGSTCIWQSVDNGETWTEFTDFSKQKQIKYETFHIHALYYDNKHDRLYVSSGDGQPNRDLWWTDDGKTWKFKNLKHYWGKSDDAYSDAQFISLYIGDDFNLAGGDDYSNCIYRLNQSDVPSWIQLTRSYFYNTTTKGLITQYTGRFKKLSNGMIVTMLVNGDSDAYPRQTRLVGTFDGYTWQELYCGQYETEASKLFQMGLFDEWNGRVYFSVRSMDEDGLHRKFIELKLNEKR